MYGVCVAEQVVHVAEYLLICAHEEHAEVIRLARAQRVHGEVWRAALRSYEMGYLAVAVAGDVLNSTPGSGLLVKARNRYYGEHLVNRPAVRQRLEQGEVAEILFGQHTRNLAQLFGRMLH